MNKYLPLLGFILRSTNVRNSFEISEPLTRLAKRLLKRALTFVVSSEWEFSPLTYTLSFQELPNVILLGFPSFESGNALVIPIAGHELGHWIWRHDNVEAQFFAILEKNIIDAFIDSQTELRGILGHDMDIGNIRTDVHMRGMWEISFDDSVRQCEEIFSDFVGLKLFGESYMHSFEYLAGPFTGEPRSRDYPDMKTRAEYLVRAAARFSVEAPDAYASHFDDSLESMGLAERFLLKASDVATQATVDNLLDTVLEISVSYDFPPLSADESERCLTRIRKGMPAEGVAYIGNIVNAGWAAYRDESILPQSLMGERRRIDALNELLLKSIEVAEFEARMRDGDAASSQ
jgi:hypothetical protein